MNKITSATALVLSTLLFTDPASAHPGHDLNLGSGLLRALHGASGFDHLLLSLGGVAIAAIAILALSKAFTK